MNIYAENSKMRALRPEIRDFSAYFSFSGPYNPEIVEKSEKNKRAEQGGPGYGPQVAAMHTLPLAANLLSTARGPIQTPDVGQMRL